MGQGVDFTKNPAGAPAKSGGGQPDSFMQSRTQSAGGDPELSQAEIPEGGKDLYADNVPAEGEEPVGVGSVGNGRPPFKGLHKPA